MQWLCHLLFVCLGLLEVCITYVTVEKVLIAPFCYFRI
jgi:hypothetical protein